MYDDAEVTPVETTAVELFKKANPGAPVISSTDVAARTVTVPPAGEYRDKRVCWHFTRNYATHAETWVVLQADDPKPDDAWYKNYGFQDRNGQWYHLYHDYHHVSAQADGHYASWLEDGLALNQAFWQVVL